MWNNYTVHMLNPDKIATRHAEADALRLADEAERAPDEVRVSGEHRFWATAGTDRVVANGTSFAIQLRDGAVGGIRSARHGVAAAAAGLRHAHRPHLAAGHRHA